MRAVASQSFTKLLAQLYETQGKSRRVVEGAGLDAAYIEFKDNAIDNWHNIVVEAKKRGRVKVLVQFVCKEYPERREALTTLAPRDKLRHRIPSNVRAWLLADIAAILLVAFIYVTVWAWPAKLSAEPFLDSDFKNIAAKWVTASKDVKEENGWLRIKNSESLTLPRKRLYGDFRAVFNVKLEPQGSASWAVRGGDLDTYYLFRLSGGEGGARNNLYVNVAKVIDGALRPPETRDLGPAPASTEQQQYDICVTVVGNSIRTEIVSALGRPIRVDFDASDVLKTVVFYHREGRILGFLTQGSETFWISSINVRPIRPADAADCFWRPADASSPSSSGRSAEETEWSERIGG